MQINKKIHTSLLIALLAMSAMIVAVPMVSAEVTVTPTATPSSGAVGTEVTLNATGGADPFSTVTIYLDALSGTVLGSTDADVDGTYSIEVTIPPTTAGLHYLVANDGETESRGAAFTVTPRLVINSIPAVVGIPTVLPGDELTVTGDGFAASEDITLNFTAANKTNTFVIATPAISSDANGSFEATITVPAVVLSNFDTYVVNATDESDNFAIDYVIIDYYITCTPSAGPTGITTTIGGRIAANEYYAIRFNGATIGTGTTAADGSYSTTYVIPAVLSPNDYTVDVLWNTTYTRNTTFTVTPAPVITLSAYSGIVGATIGIEGSGFSNLANMTLYFGTNVINSTASGFGPTNATGGFDLTFEVPNMALGIYPVSVVDQYGATSASGVYFTIEPTPVMEIRTRATAYLQGDQISIYTWSNLDVLTTITYTITDPSGLILVTDTLSASAWEMISANNYMVEDYYDYWCDPEYMTLPADAPVGTWNFTAVVGSVTYSNLFTVSAPASLDGVMTGIGDIQDTLADMTDMIDSIDGDVVTIKGDTASIESLINNLDIPDMSELSGDLETLQMSVDSLDAVVGSIAGTVATVETTLGTLEGTITSIDGNVATIETDVGTLEADMSDVKANVDNTPAWIAVVLALVAAVAAIFAVITIRQKIAG